VRNSGTSEAAQANRNAVARHENPYGVAYNLKDLDRYGLLTGEVAQANFNAIVGHRQPRAIVDALEKPQ
jgi:hypothetical protein